MIEEGTVMHNSLDRAYRTQQFADLAGVTVRTLHHYDRLGLLKPKRTAAGYRIYRSRDLERLEQIVALKFLGLPLKQIRAVLDRDRLALPDALRVQRKVLEERRRQLDGAILAIRHAEMSIVAGSKPDAAVLKQIIEVLEMQNNPEWTSKYYSEEARQKIEGRRHLWSPELQERVSREWTELYRDVESAIADNAEPAGERAQALAARWRKLLEGFTGGDREIQKGLNKLWRDQENWPASAQQQMKPFVNPVVWEYMSKVLACQ
jgi:DNA-binding transcriptional MerR regulator